MIPPETPYIGLEHMPRKNIALSEWGSADAVESSKFAFKAKEILFGKLRPYFHKVGVATVDGVCSTDILVLSPKSHSYWGLVLFLVSSEDFVQYTDRASAGTKMPRTNWIDMARYELAIPPEETALAFTEVVEPMVDRINANILESRNLAAIRDTLLPKLLSGEIRVKQAEKLVGEVV
jgi:type I restriction enzyme S subunit